MSTSFNPPNMSQFMKYALMAGVLLILAMIVPLNHDQFFEAYLIGWTFWTGIAIGSLALLMLQHLTGGGWGFVIRRILEASTRTLPVMAVLFIPILLGAHSLYHHWMDPEEVKKHAVVAVKTPYLNFPFFAIRAVIYFAVWLALAYFFEPLVVVAGSHRRQPIHEEDAHVEWTGNGGADFHRHVRVR